MTPDSFFAQSRCLTLDDTLRKAEAMIQAGADILDIGGESTSKMAKRYGYSDGNSHYVGGNMAQQRGDTVNEQQELERVLPVVEALAQRFDTVLSVDTSSALVINAVCAAGAGMINDVRALQRPGALAAAAAVTVPVVLMHSLVDHPAPGFEPHYHDVVQAVMDDLGKAIARCQRVGIDKHRLLIDPGFGGGLFGKTPIYDLSLLKHLSRLHTLNLPIVVGLSRKSFIGAVLAKDPDERLAGSLAAAIIAAQAGAHILRVHDVAATHDAVRMVQAIEQQH